MSSTQSREVLRLEVKPEDSSSQPWQKWRAANQKKTKPQQQPHYWWEDMN